MPKELNLSQRWEIEHRRKILTELAEANIPLTEENIPRIIKQTSFKIRSQNYPEECPFYSQEQSCHPEIKDLNCFLCACPNYISERLEGGCKINSKFGRIHKHENLPAGKIWDCSSCTINHSPKEIKNYLEANITTIK